MDLIPNEEQTALIEATSSLLRKELPSPLSAAAGSDIQRGLLQRCATLGWFGLGLPESCGGAGATVVEELLVYREIGRHLAPGPLLATTLGARVAATAGDAELASQISTGTVPVALAESIDGAAPGRPALAFDAQAADLLVLVSRSSAQLVGAPPISAVRSIDDLTTLGRCNLAESMVVADSLDPRTVWLSALALSSAVLAGIAAAALNMSIDYLKVREQFGKPVGAFQALKHRAADMAVESERAFATAAMAALSVERRDRRADFFCLSARIVCSAAGLANARSNVQNHGAVGTTFDNDAHLYVKRAHVLNEQFGGTSGLTEAILGEPSPLRRHVGGAVRAEER